MAEPAKSPEAKFLEQRALIARAGVRCALRELGHNVAAAVAPANLVRRHPLRTCALFMAAAATATGMAVNKKVRRSMRRAVTGAYRVVRDTVVPLVASRLKASKPKTSTNGVNTEYAAADLATEHACGA
jgi:hypothetical protein